MAISSFCRSRTLAVRLLVLSTALVGNVQCNSASEILAVFDKPIQLFGNVSCALSIGAGHGILTFLDDE